MYEPSELERGHFTDKDQEIRITDLPEQFLQRTYPVVPREPAELEQEAKWIYQQAFVTRTISKQVSKNWAKIILFLTLTFATSTHAL